jgi:hypothetical protein
MQLASNTFRDGASTSIGTPIWRGVPTHRQGGVRETTTNHPGVGHPPPHTPLSSQMVCQRNSVGWDMKRCVMTCDGVLCKFLYSLLTRES